jgi:hypothetical protein
MDAAGVFFVPEEGYAGPEWTEYCSIPGVHLAPSYFNVSIMVYSCSIKYSIDYICSQFYNLMISFSYISAEIRI